MKNENKMKGRGVQFGLKRENQSNPKSKNQKKMTLRVKGIEVKKLNRKRREKERKKRKMKKRGRGKGRRRERERERGERGERENFPPDHRRRNPTLPPIPWLRLII